MCYQARLAILWGAAGPNATGTERDRQRQQGTALRGTSERAASRRDQICREQAERSGSQRRAAGDGLRGNGPAPAAYDNQGNGDSGHSADQRDQSAQRGDLGSDLREGQ